MNQALLHEYLKLITFAGTTIPITGNWGTEEGLRCFLEDNWL